MRGTRNPRSLFHNIGYAQVPPTTHRVVMMRDNIASQINRYHHRNQWEQQRTREKVHESPPVLTLLGDDVTSSIPQLLSMYPVSDWLGNPPPESSEWGGNSNSNEILGTMINSTDDDNSPAGESPTTPCTSPAAATMESHPRRFTVEGQNRSLHEVRSVPSVSMCRGYNSVTRSVWWSPDQPPTLSLLYFIQSIPPLHTVHHPSSYENTRRSGPD